MNNFEDIQNLWQQSRPDGDITTAQMMRQIRYKQRREKGKLFFSTAVLVLTFLFILFIAFHYRFAFFSTNIGIALILLSIVAAVFMNSRMISLLLRNTAAADTDNKTMLANMNRFRQRQVFFQTTFLSAYYGLLTLGLMLYMYEITRSNLTLMFVAYSLTLGWIAFAWWYIRPRTIRRQQERTDAIISHIRSLQADMEEL